MTTPSFKKAVTTREPHKKLVRGGKRGVGRNNAGRITMRHRGAGVKRRMRDVDFRYKKRDIPMRVEQVEYDPNRSGYLARVVYRDGARAYVLAPQQVSVGDTWTVSEKAKIEAGNRVPLSRAPVGAFVYNIETRPEAGAKLVRSAGNYAEVIAQDGDYTHLKMPSSEVRKIISKAWATIGAVSNEEHRLTTIGKAGRSRKMGIRPTVRGSVMNPVDHPHGGGEGRAGRGHRRQRTKWGKPAGKRQKTRRPKKYSNKLIVSRRKVGKRR